MATRVIKVGRLDIFRWNDWGKYRYRLTTANREDWPVKLALSFKVGKKRKLVKGRVESVPNSDRGCGLYWEYYFLPNNADKLELYLK